MEPEDAFKPTVSQMESHFVFARPIVDVAFAGFARHRGLGDVAQRTKP
jgi:hypothetical protein